MKEKKTVEVLVPKSHIGVAFYHGDIVEETPEAWASLQITRVRKAAGCSAVMVEDTELLTEKEYHYVVKVDWYENE